MISKPITLKNEKTWPTEIIACLEMHHDIFYSWEARRIGLIEDASPALEYDKAHENLKDVANNFLLKGYHCTRLIPYEIEEIKKSGLILQDGITLNARIDHLIKENIISQKIGDQLKTKNQADDQNRAKKLWFCFFMPHLAGEIGIKRFFLSWGGEALYNSHERNNETGPILARIGNPCLIEANIAICSIKSGFLTDNIARIYLKNRGLKTKESCEFAGYSQSDISPNNIVRIIQHPSPKFINLTRCNKWAYPP